MKKDNQKFEIFFDSLKEALSLSEKEKSVLKSRLVERLYVTKARSVRTSLWSRIFIQNKINKPMPILLYVLAALVALGGGTAVLADEAGPGDVLYPIDQFVERVQERLIINPEAKLRLFGRFNEERLTELEELEGATLEELNERARELWEKHRGEAAQRFAESTERMNALKLRLQARLEEATTDEQRDALQAVLNHLEAKEALREERLDRIENREFPADSNRATPLLLRERIEELRDQPSEEAEEIVENLRKVIEHRFPPVVDPNDVTPLPELRFPNDEGGAGRES